ncbi:hypothetical protein HCH54_008579 [Aspergillus fumigatus]
MISKWVKMAETSERDEINTFIESVRTDPGGLAKYIAERHVASWWTARYPIEAYTSFRLAHQALFDAGSGDVSETDWNAAGEKEIYDQFIRVSNAFDQRSPETKDGKIHAQRLRCRSMALRYDGLYKRAIDDIDKAINSKPDGEEKWKLFDRRGRIYFGWAEDVEDDIHNGDSITKGDESQEERRKKYLTEANKAFDEVLDDSTLWKEQMNMTYQLKAKTEALLGNMEQCLRTIGEASALDPQPLIYFDNIVARIMMSNGDERVTRIQTLLEKVPKGQLAAGCTDKTHELLQRAASQSEDHTRLLSEMYKEAVKALKAHHEGASVNSMRIWRALFARQVEKNVEKAKKGLQKALIPKVASDINAITLASWRLADILLQEFWNPEHRTDQKLTPCDILAAREEVRCQMTQLVRTINVQVPEFQPELSQTSIPLAMMQHELGPKVTFKKEVDAIFTACCEALNDNLASNDSPSLQMLAKVLSLLPGLTSHAQTAFTCQFYIIDEEQHRQEVAKADAAPKNGPGPGSARSKRERDHSYRRRATATIKHDMSISRSTDNYHRKQSVKQTILGGSVVNNAYSSQRKRNVTRYESSSNKTSGSQQVNQQVTFEEPDVSSTPADVFTQTSVQCSSCRKSIHRGNLQKEKAFLCYFCTNTIFCGDCYNSYSTRNRQSERMLCQTYHQHIKAPVCNWKELAEGRLILEGKETPFKDWLASLKTAWEEAWEKCLRLPSDSEARPTYF